WHGRCVGGCGRHRRRRFPRSSGATDQERRGFAYGRTPSHRFGLLGRRRFVCPRGGGLRVCDLAAWALRPLRTHLVPVPWPFVAPLLARRSAKISDRMRDFLFDGRSVVFRRTDPSVAVLATIAPTAAAAAPPPPPAVAIGLIGLNDAGSLQLLIAETGVDVA